MTSNDYFKMIDRIDRFMESHDRMIRHKYTVEDLENQLCSLPGVTKEQGNLIIYFLSRHCLFGDYADILSLVIQDISENGVDKVLKEIHEIEESQENDDFLFNLKKTSKSNRPLIVTNDEEIETLPGKPTEMFFKNITKLAKNMPSNNLNRELTLTVSGQKSKKKVEITALIIRDKNVNINSPINFYDMLILDAIDSLWEAGNYIFTSDMVARVAKFLGGSAYIKDNAVKQVEESIEKLRGTKVTINYTDQLNMNRKPHEKVDKAVLDDMALSLTGATVKAGGNIVKGYQFNTMPILWRYAKDVGNYTSIEISKMNTKDCLKATDGISIMKSYIFGRIAEMKNEKRKSMNRIRYREIYEQVGLISMEDNEKYDNGKYKKPLKDINCPKEKARDIRNNAKIFLNHLVKQDYIKGFKEYSYADIKDNEGEDKRTKAGLEIFYQ